MGTRDKDKPENVEMGPSPALSELESLGLTLGTVKTNCHSAHSKFSFQWTSSSFSFLY